MIERAYTLGEVVGVSVWCEDEAGPYGTVPYPGTSWQPEGQPAQLPHEYFRDGTAKMLTLLHPKTGEVRVKGVPDRGVSLGELAHAANPLRGAVKPGTEPGLEATNYFGPERGATASGVHAMIVEVDPETVEEVRNA